MFPLAGRVRRRPILGFSSAARLIECWGVEEDVEKLHKIPDATATLSKKSQQHQSATSFQYRGEENGQHPQLTKCSIKKLVSDTLIAAALVTVRANLSISDSVYDVDIQAFSSETRLRDLYDMPMLRSRANRCQSTYW